MKYLKICYPKTTKNCEKNNASKFENKLKKKIVRNFRRKVFQMNFYVPISRSSQ